jgi:hypothetical protein
MESKTSANEQTRVPQLAPIGYLPIAEWAQLKSSSHLVIRTVKTLPATGESSSILIYYGEEEDLLRWAEPIEKANESKEIIKEQKGGRHHGHKYRS